MQAVTGGGTAVEEDAALLRIVEAEEERGDGRLARAAGADQGDDLPFPRAEAEILEHGYLGPGGIAKETCSKLTSPRKRGGWIRTGRSGGGEILRRLGEQLAHPLGRADGALKVAVEVGKAPDRAADEDGVKREAEELALGQPVVDEVESSPYQRTTAMAVKMAKIMKATRQARAFAPCRTELRKRSSRAS